MFLIGWLVIATERFVVAVLVVVKFAGDWIVTVGGMKATAYCMVIFVLEAGSGLPASRACTTSGL